MAGAGLGAGGGGGGSGTGAGAEATTDGVDSEGTAAGLSEYLYVAMNKPMAATSATRPAPPIAMAAR